MVDRSQRHSGVLLTLREVVTVASQGLVNHIGHILTLKVLIRILVQDVFEARGLIDCILHLQK